MKDDFEKVARVGDFAASKTKEARVGDTHLALFSIDGKIYAVENNCPHQHFEVLHQGRLEGFTITCPMHGRIFDLETGSCLNGDGRLKKIEIKILDDEIWAKTRDTNRPYALFDKK